MEENIKDMVSKWKPVLVSANIDKSLWNIVVENIEMYAERRKDRPSINERDLKFNFDINEFYKKTNIIVAYLDDSLKAQTFRLYSKLNLKDIEIELISEPKYENDDIPIEQYKHYYNMEYLEQISVNNITDRIIYDMLESISNDINNKLKNAKKIIIYELLQKVHYNLVDTGKSFRPTFTINSRYIVK